MSEPVKTGEYFEHITGPGERWDTIAFRYYNDASLSHVLIHANRHLFIDDLSPVPPILLSRTTLRIPVIETAAIDDSLLPPWKRSSLESGSAS